MTGSAGIQSAPTSMILIDAIKNDLLFGFVPETLELFVLGIALIAFAVGLRWFFNRNKEIKTRENFGQVTVKVKH